MLYTSYFAKYKGKQALSIASSTPDWFVGGHADEFKPNWVLVSKYKHGLIDEKEYEREYLEYILSRLDPNEMHEKYRGKVLLCYEKPDDFCHRHIIAKWFNINGIKCRELNQKDFDKIKQRSK